MKKKPDVNIKRRESMYSLDQLVPHAGGSIFVLARLAMLRALQIDGGSRPLVDFLPLAKPTTIALKEIALGKVTIGEPPSKTKQKVEQKAEDIELAPALQ